MTSFLSCKAFSFHLSIEAIDSIRKTLNFQPVPKCSISVDEYYGRFSDMLSNNQTRFMALHLFGGGHSNRGANSFEKFIREPGYLKRYIINLHRIAPGAHVFFLYNTKQDLKDGIREMKEKRLIIIDSNIDTLQNDIKNQVQI